MKWSFGERGTAMLTCTYSKNHLAGNDQNAAHGNKHSGTMAIKDGTNLNAGKEDDKQIQAEDPANGRRVGVGELVRRKVGLEDGRTVDQAVDRQHGAEGAEHDEPGPEAALGEGPLWFCIYTIVMVRVRRGGRGDGTLVAYVFLRSSQQPRGLDSLIYLAAVICMVKFGIHTRSPELRRIMGISWETYPGFLVVRSAVAFDQTSVLFGFAASERF